MKPLSIDKALQLYKILAPYIPDEADDDFNFIGKIINSIKNSGNHRAYTDALELLTGFGLHQIQEFSAEELLSEFATGLAENRLLSLMDFCKKVGFYA